MVWLHWLLCLVAALLPSRADGGALRVRCVELHTYAVGGGLMERGHRDKGSAISLSALLTAPAAGPALEVPFWRRHPRNENIRPT